MARTYKLPNGTKTTDYNTSVSAWVDYNKHQARDEKARAALDNQTHQATSKVTNPMEITDPQSRSFVGNLAGTITGGNDVDAKWAGEFGKRLLTDANVEGVSGFNADGSYNMKSFSEDYYKTGGIANLASGTGILTSSGNTISSGKTKVDFIGTGSYDSRGNEIFAYVQGDGKVGYTAGRYTEHGNFVPLDANGATRDTYSADDLASQQFRNGGNITTVNGHNYAKGQSPQEIAEAEHRGFTGNYNGSGYNGSNAPIVTPTDVDPNYSRTGASGFVDYNNRGTNVNPATWGTNVNPATSSAKVATGNAAAGGYTGKEGMPTSGGTFEVTSNSGEVIAWNVTAIRQVAAELAKVSENFAAAHEQCAVLVPKINAAWDSNLAAEKFEEKLDLGLVKHFDEGTHAIKVLSDLLNKIADIYHDCETRIKNGDYGTTYRVGETTGGTVTWANDGFNVINSTPETRSPEAHTVIGDVDGGHYGEPVYLNNAQLSDVEKSAFRLGLPVGAYKRFCAGNGTTHYFDANGNELGYIYSNGRVELTPVEAVSFASQYGALATDGSDVANMCNNAIRIPVSDLSDAEVANLRGIYKNGISGDVEFYRGTDGSLYTAIKNATGHIDGQSTAGMVGNQTGAATVYKVEDGRLEMLGESSVADIKAAQAARTSTRQAELAAIKYEDTIDYDVKIETIKKPTPVPITPTPVPITPTPTPTTPSGGTGNGGGSGDGGNYGYNGGGGSHEEPLVAYDPHTGQQLTIVGYDSQNRPIVSNVNGGEVGEVAFNKGNVTEYAFGNGYETDSNGNRNATYNGMSTGGVTAPSSQGGLPRAVPNAQSLAHIAAEHGGQSVANAIAKANGKR